MSLEQNGRGILASHVALKGEPSVGPEKIHDPLGVIVTVNRMLQSRDRRVKPREALHRPSDRVTRAMTLQAQALERMIGTPASPQTLPSTPRRVNR